MLKALLFIVELGVVVIIIWLLHAIFTLIHELGHGLAYQMVTSNKNWYMTINKGKKLLETKKLTLYLTPYMGYCGWEPRTLKTKKQFVIALGGGPFATLMVIILFLVLNPYINVDNLNFLSPSMANFLLELTMNYNVAMLISTVLPINIDLFGDDYVSDGYQIMEFLKNN